jgi:hypothetical protein
MNQPPEYPYMVGDHRLLVQHDPLLRQDELASRLRPTTPGKVGVFDLSVPEQLQQYEDVVDRAGRGEFILCREEVNWNAAKGHYVVFARWIEQQMEVLPADAVLAKGVSGNAPGYVRQ